MALSLAFAGSALAADPKDKKAEDGQYVTLSPVALPVVVDRQLINFVFVTVKLKLAPSANMAALRDREPYFRDALVHTAYRQPFTVPTNYTVIDIGALKARMKAEANRIAGPGQIIAVELAGEPQPKKLSGLPRPKGLAPVERAPIP